MKKRLIIIGAGISGLSAGCYGQMNGYETEIFEMHNVSGGLCTSWKRKGYIIDGCISFLTGTNPDTNFYRVWSELGAAQNTNFIHYDEIIRLARNGGEFILYSDLGRLEKHMLETAPEDEAVIRQLIQDAKKICRLNPPIDKSTFGEKIKMISEMLPYIGILGKYRMPVKEYTQQFKNLLLREALTYMYSPDFPASFILFSLANHHNKNAGFPANGSLEFAKSIENRYLSLGGKINFCSKVDRILVENNRAVGIKLSDGSEHFADAVISASDGYSTIFKMLEGRYIDDKIKNTYGNVTPMTPCIRVHLGVNEDLSRLPHALRFDLENSINIAGEKRSSMAMNHYCQDRSFAPEGKSIIKVHFETSFNYWDKLYTDRELYKKEKQAIAETVIDELDKKFKGIKAKIEMVDVTTPKTYERYTGTWQGSYMGWKATPKTVSLKLSKTLPKLSNFYMAGHWLEGLGGLPTAAISGRDIVKLICKDDKKKFISNK